MKPLLSVSLWTLLLSSALLLEISQAQCVSSECGSNETEALKTLTTTTTTVTFGSSPNCNISTDNNISGNGSITGLTPGAVYPIFLKCLNCCKEATTKPGVVGNLSVTAITTSSISLKWTEPEGNSSSYRVQWTGGNVPGSNNVTQTHITITNLIAGVQYEINVTAVADDGLTEGKKDTVSQYTKPAVVRNLSVSEITTSSISLMWTKPEGNSSFYRVQWTGGNTHYSVKVTETDTNITELTAGVQYNFTVIAVAADNKTESEGAQTFHYTKPEVVRNLSVTEITTSSISLMWTKPEGNSSFYRVQWTDGNVPDSNNVTQTHITITNLTAGVQYEITVTAVAGDGSTDGQSTTVTQYTKPEVVRNLSVTEVTTSSISLKWTKPEGNSSFYRVQWTDGTTNHSVKVTETNITITELTAGVQYNFTVIAVAADNKTESKGAQIFRHTKPEVVRNLSVTEITTSSISLKWTEPEGNSSFYRVQWTDGNVSYSNNVTQTHITITNLTAGVQYEITVTAVTGDGSTDGQSTTVYQYTKPEAVKNISVSEITTSSISLKWTKPEGNSSFYRVQWTDGTTNYSVKVTETNITITELTAGVQYNFTVIAVAADNKTESKGAQMFRHTKPEVVRNLSVTEITTSSISLKWTEPEGNSSFYRVQWTDGNVSYSNNVTQTHITITNLTAGVQYEITVTAVTGDGSTDGQSTTVYQYTKPEAVKNISVSEITTSSISLKWTKPEGNSSFYRVQWTDGTTNYSVKVTETNITITELTAGVQYNFTVIAVAADNKTESKGAQMFRHTKPEVVRNLSVTEITTSSISLKWTKPEGNSSFYRVQWTDGNVPDSNNVTQTHITITNLTAGVQYEITVTAVAGDGSTEGQSTTVYQYTKPEVVKNLSVTEVTTSSISLKWTKPEGNSSFYRVQWTDGTTNHSVKVTETNKNITELTAGVQYNFTVIAVAADNKTESKGAQMFRHTKPEVVRNLSVTEITTSSISLKWTKPEGNSSFYRVQWTDGNVPDSNNVTQTHITITNLIAGVQYEITVTAVAGDGSTDGQSTTVYQYIKPEVVRNLSVTEITTSSISLKWTKPEGNSSFYRVQWTDGTTNYSVKVTETNKNITELTAGVQYNFTVIAVAADNKTESKGAQMFRHTKPEVVRNLSVTEITTSSISLKWTKPEGNSSFYRVQWTDGNVPDSNNVTQTHITITNLIAGVQYEITVTAVAGDGSTDGQSTTVTQYTRPCDFDSKKNLHIKVIFIPPCNTSSLTEPEVVRNLSVTEVTTSSISLKWTKPEGNSSFYRVQWTDGTTNHSVKVTETNITITELTAGVQYNFTVIAVAADNKTESEGAQIFRHTKPEVVRNLSVTEITTSSISLKWTEPEGNSSFYRVQWTDGNVSYSNNVTQTHITITNLIAGVQYEITVTAVAGDGSTDGQSTTVYQYIKPEVVRNLSVTEITTSSISLKWTKPEGNSSFYRVQWTDGTTNYSVKVTETNKNITELTAGVQYNFTVIAVAADNKTESKGAQMFRHTKPEVVRNLSVTEITTSSISLKWTKPEGNSSFYRVQWTDGNVPDSNNVTQTHITITNLIAGVQYEITVTAVAGDGSTDGQSTTVTQYTKPEVVRNLSVTEITTSSISLKWTKPEGNSSFYRVQWTDGTTNYSVKVTETNKNITELTAGVQYNFTVIAVAADNKTESEGAQIFHNTKPEVVRNLSVTEVTTSSISLMWTKPEGNSSFYRVQWTDGNVPGSNNVTQAHITISNLTAGVKYEINVTAVAGDGSTDGQSTTVTQYTKPEVVRNLSVTEITTSSISLKWTEPEGSSSFYRVQWTDGNVSDSNNVTQAKITISNLTAGVQYEITVTAVAGDGSTDGQSTTVSQYTKPEVVTNLSVTEITTSSISLKWTEPEGNSSFYRVQWTDGNVPHSNNVTQAQITISNLTAGVQYEINVTAVAGDGSTDGQSTTVSQYTKPEVVTNLTVTEITTSSISLKWTEPEGNSSFYRVQWTDGNVPHSNNVTQAQITISNLTAGVQYEINVTAVAGDGSTDGQSTTVSQYTKPEVVTNLSVTEITTSSISLKWTEPEGNSSFYRVQWTDGNVPHSNNVTQAQITISNLTAGVQYEINVTAVAGDGSTDGQSTTVSQYTKPGEIGEPTVSTKTSSISLNWTSPPGEVFKYGVEWTSDGAPIKIFTYDTFAVLSDLIPGTRYTISVIAVARDNQTEGNRRTFTSVTKPALVGNLSITEITTSSVSLDWTKPEGNATSYTVQWTAGENTFSNTTTETSFTINGLIPGYQYNITVAAVAVNSSNKGQETFTSTFTSSVVFLEPNPVLNLVAIPKSTTSVNVKWSEPQGAQMYYTYLVQTYSTTGALFNITVSNNSTDVPDLEPGTRYNINVTTIAATGSESTVEQTFSYTMPKAVTNLTVEDMNTTAIRLTWLRQSDHKLSYSYLVIALQDAVVVHNDSTETETYTFFNMTPGKLYTFHVFTVVGGVKSAVESTSSYTKPGVVSDVIAIGSTTTMSVSWTPADGQVDSYTVLLYRDGHLVGNGTDLSNTTKSKQFQQLTPGVRYCVKVVTKSGPFESSDGCVYNATFPNPPGPIMVDFQTVESINFTWSFPENMDHNQYNFSVSSINGSFLIGTNRFRLDKLQSGSPYNISVVTVGVYNYESTAVTTENYTRPYPVTMLRQTKITTNAVTLAWEQPESKSSYRYVVEATNGSFYPSEEVLNKHKEITGLLSGSNYSFTVTTQTADGTKAAAVTVSYFTRPYSIGQLEAETLNTTAVRLVWMQPLEYKTEYTYRVESTGFGSQKTKNETFALEVAEISQLSPGTNYTFCVSVRAADGIEGEASCTAQYTKPEAVQPSVSSQGSNSSILVLWTKPPGKVEHYKVYLNSPSTALIEEVVLNSTDTSVLFDNLSAGRLYTVVVTTHSGPFNASSGFITNATFPNPPGPIDILEKTTSSIAIVWKEAPLMTGTSFHYQLGISPTQGGGYINTTNTSHTFDSLRSGTPFNFSVATVGAIGFESERVQIHMVTTRPFSVRFLAASTEENSITVMWHVPNEYKESYRYNVSWQSPDGTLMSGELLQENKTNINNLVSGERYNISVTTETSDGTKGAPRWVSNCTNASPVTNLKCEGPNTTNAKVILSWTEPSGKHSGFQINVDNDIITSTSTCCGHTVSNLQHNTEYNLTLETQSCGAPSTPVPLLCQTGITNPPIPGNYESLVKVVEKLYNKFNLQIDSSLLDNTNGPITDVGVLVTNALPSDTSNLTKYVGKTYDQWKAKETPVYLATVAKNTFSSKRSGESHLNIEVGNGSSWKGYTNGVLEANGKYQYAIVLFTSVKLKDKDNLVDGQQSLLSITNFYYAVALPQNPAVNIGIAVGVTLGIFCVLFIILVGFIIYWKRISNKETSDIQIHSMRSVAVRVEDYEAYYKKQKADSNCGFAEEFEDLKLVGTAQSKTNALTLENKPKNRYNNVLPYDSSRVKLSIIHGSPYDDYINANYMPGYNSRKEYIAAQGPLPTTVNEFWRMIWEKNVQTLVMLTRCNEQGRVKCEQYWDYGTKYYENITVTATSEIPLEDWTIRDFVIKNVKTAETRAVRHFHFTAWPDHGVPQTTELLISFRHLVREHMDQYSRHSPTVVHCSAGVGRTGTFIAIDRLIFQIERENIVDVYGIVHDQRMHRPLMVQTEDQYVFLNQCSMDIIRSRTGTNVDLIYQNAAALSIYENFEPKKGFPKNGYRNA
ncbi:phosphatidylinositol phosphatase PTPRQ [Sebastes fasciatus]|uniref:phosphatidylinositol phosphatase PTPRQ n=1 Tax=Sebastes fasciatus TaxID=394691 RepID=UPI003D9F6A1E